MSNPLPLIILAIVVLFIVAKCDQHTAIHRSRTHGNNSVQSGPDQ